MSSLIMLHLSEVLLSCKLRHLFRPSSKASTLDRIWIWLLLGIKLSTFCGGGATRPLPRDGGMRELYGGPTVGLGQRSKMEDVAPERLGTSRRVNVVVRSPPLYPRGEPKWRNNYPEGPDHLIAPNRPESTFCRILCSLLLTVTAEKSRQAVMLALHSIKDGRQKINLLLCVIVDLTRNSLLPKVQFVFCALGLTT